MESKLSPPNNQAVREVLLDLVSQYAEALKAQLGDSLLAIVLFGSLARGEATSDSDIDLLIVAEGLPGRRLARHDLLRSADEAVDQRLRALWREGIRTDFSPILKTPEEAQRITPLYLDLVEDAVILYEREGFFSAILERVRRSLARLGARRRQLGRVRYWELKPDYTPGEIFEI
ncbi:MAG: nucleotidyltransferase domain-containing protein [Anaerolineae bacterium]|nr:nucleotidyltransferase domain-containing protein [Anaerolineae bacterium]